MTEKRNIIIITLSFLICFVFFMPRNVMAEDNKYSEIVEDIEEIEEKFDAGELIFDHILDSYDWHICT